MSHQKSKHVSANAAHESEHGGAVTVARNAVGSVSVCQCGIVTLSLQYISLRLESSAFGDLQALVNQARHRFDRFDKPVACTADVAPLH